MVSREDSSVTSLRASNRRDSNWLQWNLQSQPRHIWKHTTQISQRRNSSQVSSNTQHQAQSAPWYGKVIMQSPPDVRCLVLPDHLTLSQAPFVEITALMSAETSVTDLIQLRAPTKRLNSGSLLKSFASGKTILKPGSTNELLRNDHKFHQNYETLDFDCEY